MDGRIMEHCLLGNKNLGPSRELKGEVAVITVFVDDAQSRWDKAAIESFKGKLSTAGRYLEKEAAAKGVQLDIRNLAGRIQVDIACDTKDYGWEKTVLEKYKKADIMAFQEHYERVFDCDEAAVQFVFNKSFRSWAVSANKSYPNWNEFSALSACASVKTVAHELLHQFGAMDLYYPQQIKCAAEKYFPDSIMNGGMQIDPLTAYLVGWSKDVCDESLLKFLNCTAHLTAHELAQAASAQLK